MGCVYVILDILEHGAETMMIHVLESTAAEMESVSMVNVHATVAILE